MFMGRVQGLCLYVEFRGRVYGSSLGAKFMD